MRVARAAALGLLHGPLELLPVSSSAHVALLSRPGGDGPEEAGRAKELEVALHAGTLLALGPGRPRPWLVLAAAPAALAGALLEGPIQRRLGTARTLPGGLVLGALALALADRAAAPRRVARPTARDALALGLAQAAALVPGVSRHGAVLAAARARGFDRPAAPGSRSPTTTRAPRRCSSAAVARPMPRAPPVIATVRPGSGTGVGTPRTIAAASETR